MSEYWTTQEDFDDENNTVIAFVKGRKVVKRFTGAITADNVKDIMRCEGISQFKVYEQQSAGGDMTELNVSDFPYDGNVVVTSYDKGAI